MHKRNELYLLDIPSTTSTYKPVSHKEIIENILEGIDSTNYKLRSEVYLTNSLKTQAVGRYGLEVSDSSMGFEIMFQNSLDKTLSLKFALGVHNFLCTNGLAFGSDGFFKSKHVGEIQQFTPVEIKNLINKTANKFDHILQYRKDLQEIEISKKTCAELIGRLYIDEQLITSTQVNIIKNEIYNPTFDYKSKDSAWEFWNHVTFGLRKAHPMGYIDNSLKIFNFFQDNLLN